jgi:uncharacterized membrane-anchored protein YitT (DUF2179 family)
MIYMNKTIKTFCGILLASAGLLVLNQAHLVTGGAPGIALLLSYLFGIPFSTLFFIVNIPFYILAIRKIGWSFTTSTLAAVTCVTILTGLGKCIPQLSLSLWVGAIAGGLLIGLGLAILFLNKSSMGGTGILVVYLQRRFGWNPGKINLLFDTLIVSSSLYTMGLLEGFLSVPILQPNKMYNV